VSNCVAGNGRKEQHHGRSGPLKLEFRTHETQWVGGCAWQIHRRLTSHVTGRQRAKSQATFRTGERTGEKLCSYFAATLD
jgi:hypothetical protein